MKAARRTILAERPKQPAHSGFTLFYTEVRASLRRCPRRAVHAAPHSPLRALPLSGVQEDGWCWRLSSGGARALGCGALAFAV